MPKAFANVLTLLAFPLLAGAEVDFNRDIRPLLSQNCFACHGPDGHERKAKLRLDTEAGSREVIADGEFVARITETDPDEHMPPPETGKKLSEKQIELLREWVAQGAKYSEPWAYVPPRRHAVPALRDGGWTRNWIDLFLLDRWSREGLSPSGDADAITLARRLHFDLLGLPADPLVIAAHLSTDASDVVDERKQAEAREKAYEKLVDTLLASEHFGERMAIYWLDLVRFADTVGYHGDQDHSITPYRDYVIDAFNRNLPFDQFTREQLAGDLLENPSVDQKVATGYNRLLQTSHEGGVQAKEYLAIYAADRIRNLSGVWIGGTLGCAQCHDHKYDPYTARDFYSMSAFFADIDEAQHFKVGSNSLPTKRPPEIKVLSRRDRERLVTLDEVEPRTPGVEAQIKAIKARERLTMVTQAIEPRVTRILPRGNWLDDSGEIVQPAVPAFLGKLEPGDRRANRLDLANWLVDPKDGIGGLTARVFVNRMWYLMFGVGISSSLEDFGGQGLPPVHPELLDTLAVEFYESGWDVKALLKTIVMSHAYRQSSLSTDLQRQRDPAGQMFTRQSRHRLPAEMVRDNVLAVGGLLNSEIGGASVKPYQPEGYYRHLNFPVRKYKPHTDARQYRRSVYVHWQRMFLHPVMKAMDAPSREECTPMRPRSNTPTAALVLLNDPSFVGAARGFAQKILKLGGTEVDSRLKYAYLEALFRSPDERELVVLRKLLEASGGDGLEAWTAVARAILNTSEFNTRN